MISTNTPRHKILAFLREVFARFHLGRLFCREERYIQAMRFQRFSALGVAGALFLAAWTNAAPIRVGTFTGVGLGRFWHTGTHPAAAQIGSILARPDTANLGSSVQVHPEGFIVMRFGMAGSSTGSPSETQKQEFIDALDSLDVVVFIHNTDIGTIFLDSNQRKRILKHSQARGIVSIHETTNSNGIWPGWDSLHGARLQNFPDGDRSAMVRLDTLSGTDPSWHFLNRGLADTSFVEEWLSFKTDAAVIRATPVLKTTVNVDEASYSGGMSGARIMGEDHPMSWYREFPEGGRFFYTAMGHRAQNYQGGNNPRFLRRQLYNAILWAAGVDSTGAVSVRGRSPVREFSEAARISFSGSSLSVSVQKDGPHAVEVRSLDGRLLAARRGQGRAVHEFAGLWIGTVYAVSVMSQGQRFVRMAVVK